jgi:MarR family transcriptional regulator, transcriptional regulator for hemolysin
VDITTTCGAESLAALVRRTKGLLRRAFQVLLEQHGLTDVQFRVLRRLWHGDGILIGELGKELSLDPPTLTGLVDRLEAKGLVSRRRDPDDRRAVQVYLTDQGHSLHTVVEDVRRRVEAKATKNISAEDVRLLHSLLERVCANLVKEV